MLFNEWNGNVIMNYEWVRIWKEWLWPISRYYSRIYLEKLKKTTKITVRTAGLRVEIRNRDFPNKTATSRGTHKRDEKWVQPLNMKSWRNTPADTPRRRRENDVQMDATETICEGVHWIQLDPAKMVKRNIPPAERISAFQGQLCSMGEPR